MNQPTTDKYWHPVHQCNDGIMSSVSGVRIDLLNPTPEMITLHDVAVGLSNECRFGGQMYEFYSVAMHTLLVVWLTERANRGKSDVRLLCRAAVAHDMSEAYLKDIPKPLKMLFGAEYVDIEDRWEKAIMAKWNINPTDMALVKPYDLQAVEIEYEVLRKGNYSGKEARLWNEFLLGVGWFGKYPNRSAVRRRFVQVCRLYGVE